MMVSSQRLRSRPHPARIFQWRRIVRIVPLCWLLTAVKLAAVSVRPALSAYPPPPA